MSKNLLHRNTYHDNLYLVGVGKKKLHVLTKNELQGLADLRGFSLDLHKRKDELIDDILEWKQQYSKDPDLIYSENIQLDGVGAASLNNMRKFQLVLIAKHREIDVEPYHSKREIITNIMHWKAHRVERTEDALADNYALHEIGNEHLHDFEKSRLLLICNHRHIHHKTKWTKDKLVKAILAWKEGTESSAPEPEEKDYLQKKNFALEGIGEVTLKEMDIKRLKALCWYRNIPYYFSSRKEQLVDELMVWKYRQSLKRKRLENETDDDIPSPKKAKVSS
eukprot:TRINITY_DN1993_c0_g1_i1.p1 TRINITY_DN1993_c0_g1~~TRINITY_DN1993_c0_g1_i1.p1  ORF type:complete len:296 (-),score=56.80 TRINITY_DN1993_c0_g1_i1:34-870(-)